MGRWCSSLTYLTLQFSPRLGPGSGQPPKQRNAPDRAADQRQGNDKYNSKHSELDHPDIPDRIFNRSPEGNGDDLGLAGSAEDSAGTPTAAKVNP